ncbi:MAG: gliding motility-associated C-terminal domain-containing protein [Bacteroidales bacterium]|nr:gliding motility-associated C-terminal domain-containing protein [Bacteroidales bacterium]
MSNLKEQFNNYTETPDTKVWDNISHTMKVRQYLRTAGIIAGAAVVAGIGIGIALSTGSSNSPAGHEVAANTTTMPAIAAPVTINTNDIEAVPAALPTKSEATPATTATTANSSEATATTTVAVTAAPSSSESPEAALNASETPSPAPAIAAEAEPATQPAVATTNASESNNAQDLQTVVATNNEYAPATQSTATPEQNAKNITDSTVEQQNIWIPNAIRPNDDIENNRYFKPTFTKPDEIDHYEMQIFSRGGHRIYTSKRIGDQGWDGKSEGKYVPTGVYVYLITYRDASRIVHQKRGTVTVIYNK